MNLISLFICISLCKSFSNSLAVFQTLFTWLLNTTLTSFHLQPHNETTSQEHAENEL